MSAMIDASNCPFVRAFDDLINTQLGEYVSLSKQVGGLVSTHCEMVVSAVSAQRHFLTIAANSKEPSRETLMSLLKPTSDQIVAIQEFREKNRSSEWFNHLSAISESIPALGWVTISPTPGPFVKEMADASQFYTNKVLVAFKDKDKKQVDWAKSWLAFLNELQKYIRMYHTTGLSWNAKGGDASGLSNGSSVGGGGGPAPPPPPPPPADLFANPSGPCPSGDEARLALMADLNKGTDITGRLKKVSDDQKTHKNPALKAQGPVVAKSPASAGGQQTRTNAGPPTTKPPRFELEGKKWMIEYQIGRKDIVVNSAEMTQSVNLYKCKDVVVTVKGKVNSITVDSCHKTGIVFDDIVSVVEFINCQSIQAQSMGTVPTINIEKTDSVQVYLSKESLAAEIVTAKSSAVNVSVPSGGDFVEHPIPEQFKSIWNGKGFKTEPTDIAGC